jgi:hypothetical protein
VTAERSESVSRVSRPRLRFHVVALYRGKMKFLEYIPDLPANAIVTIFKATNFLRNMRVQSFAIILIPFPLPNCTVLMAEHILESYSILLEMRYCSREQNLRVSDEWRAVNPGFR